MHCCDVDKLGFTSGEEEEKKILLVTACGNGDITNGHTFPCYFNSSGEHCVTQKTAIIR